MAIVNAIIPADALEFWAKLMGGLLGDPSTTTNPGTPEYDHRIKFFKVGEGGFVDPGTGEVPRTPDGTLRRLSAPLIQDLDAVVDATRPVSEQRYAADERGVFDKTLSPADFTFEAPSTLRVRCFLDFGEFNNDGFGNNPRMWEVGLFADHPTEVGLSSDEGLLVAYATFPLEVKTGAIQIENIVRIVLAS
jgi:hypothetical protein